MPRSTARLPRVDAIRSSPSVDLGPVKARQQAMWASGDFAVIGTTLQIVGESLCEAVDLRAGCSVLDVACGSGNATLAAARRFCNVTGIDYVPALLERGSERAAAERLDIRFIEGDAEHLPFAAASFDVVLSTFGVMFAPDQERAAQELCRVCKPGGTIGLASWTPQGFLGRLIGLLTRHVLPPTGGLASPFLWGTEEHIAELFERRADRISMCRRSFALRYASAEHFIDVFRRFYGPTHRAFSALSPSGQVELSDDMALLLGEWNRGGTRSLVVPAEYLEVVIETRGAPRDISH
jgi:ubiquinone/menaquinone biosynthesis C-methylase UbiE